MDNQHIESERDALLRRALVPKGFRPTRDADIEKMLEVIGDVPISDEKKQRMLRKINGQEPVFADPQSQTHELPAELNEQERELVALHRSKNKPLPPDLAAKIKAMEERTRDPSGSGEGLSGD